jgi:hypothetical protein
MRDQNILFPLLKSSPFGTSSSRYFHFWNDVFSCFLFFFSIETNAPSSLSSQKYLISEPPPKVLAPKWLLSPTLTLSLNLKFHELEPKELARQISLLSFNLFKGLSTRELLKQECKESIEDCPENSILLRISTRFKRVISFSFLFSIPARIITTTTTGEPVGWNGNSFDAESPKEGNCPGSIHSNGLCSFFSFSRFFFSVLSAHVLEFSTAEN